MRIELHFGDITEYNADCIVNAAKPSLLGGGGVDGAIHRKAGIELREYCKNIGACKIGEAKLSPGFNLPCKYIIHTVGPRYLFKTEDEKLLLALCYTNCLEIARNEKFQTLVFSNISTGAYGFPKDLAANISLDVISSYLVENEYPNKVILCCYDIENLELYTKLIKDRL
ncbi:macro domain-containing protein [Dysgonomonas reticulitermitis]